jgi:molecular chaperone GrpE
MNVIFTLDLLPRGTILREVRRRPEFATLRRPHGVGTMSDTKGPQVELPPELQEELETEYADAAQGSAPVAAPAGDEVAGLRAQLEELNDKYLRLAAEYDNFRRRSLRERQDVLRYGNEALMKELLASVDNLERALVHGRREPLGEEGTKLLEGVELTHRSLLATLEKNGVKEVPAPGAPFDPNVHQAVRQVASDTHAAGVVAEVLQKGYVLADRLLRPALVGVSSGPAEKSEEA